MARNYSNVAVSTTLVGGVSSSGTTIAVAATTGFPAVDFILALDADTANQELVLVTNVAGTTLTVTRGYDGTTGVAHNSGVVVRHSHAAKDFKDSRDHEAATAAHGATGAVVGTTSAQSLTNKTLDDSNVINKLLQAGKWATGGFAGTGIGNLLNTAIVFTTPFTATPAITLGVTEDAEGVNVWATAITTNGFTLNAYRDVGVGTSDVHWMAAKRTQ